MRLWGNRAVGAAAIVCAVLFGGEAQADCSFMNGSGTIPAGAGTISSQTGIVAAGDSVTVTLTGTGTVTAADFGGAVLAGTPITLPTSFTLTAARSGSTAFLVNYTGARGGGTVTFSCASSGGGANGQNAQRSAVAILNGTQSITQQGYAINNGVIGGLITIFEPASSGPKPCPKCDALERVVDQIREEYFANREEITRVEGLVRHSQDQLEQLPKKIAYYEERQQAANARGDAKLEQFLAQQVETNKQFLEDASKNLQRDTIELNGLNAKDRAIIDRLRVATDAWRKAQAEAGISELPPRPDRRAAEQLQSLMPRRPVRQSVPDELMSFDIEPKRERPASVRVTTEDLIQLAQKPDGSNSVREALAGKWNVWGEGRITGAYDSVASTNGQGFVGNVGVDYKFKPWLAAGMSVGVETFENKIGGFGGRVGTVGVSAVPYVGIRLDPNLFLSGFAGITGITYDSNPSATISARYGSTRLFLGSALTGVWHEGPWRFQPSVNLVYGSESQSAYIDTAGTSVPGQVVQYGRATAGPEVGYTFRPSDGTWSLEPFALARFNLDFATDERIYLNGLQVATRGTASGSAGGGFSFKTRDGFSARLQGSYDSIGVQGLDIWNAMLRLNWNF